jgi:hypothetical protein
MPWSNAKEAKTTGLAGFFAEIVNVGDFRAN